MQKRSGGKFGGSHTTLIDLAADLADHAIRLPLVDRVQPGMIQLGQGVAGGDRRVKFSAINGGILMKVRQSRSVQEVRVTTPRPQVVMETLARAALGLNAKIGFKRPEGREQ